MRRKDHSFIRFYENKGIDFLKIEMICYGYQLILAILVLYRAYKKKSYMTKIICQNELRPKSLGNESSFLLATGLFYNLY